MLRGFYRFRQSGKASNNLFIMPLCMNSKEGKIALMNEEKTIKSLSLFESQITIRKNFRPLS